ncbi:hypothetical protein [Aeromicrobium chenweiae]|uniref:Uncharacterized protein n=1 Tax=Aeromicrobium chenweiae TaxID=2079793 RepID=A0A2S0WII6_9ACTN|nr:hypothetical protein [Aeromicrobium chenweiae]AWB91161.1 hypothetical protein C3E78_02390 [Aeromicrobium chenweiae]TGN31680.1 hypothetical protein E4L97_11900 [Aeromicrobium chenweiae]
MRVYELAAELGVASRTLVLESGLTSHLATVPPETETSLRDRHPAPSRPPFPKGRGRSRPGPRRLSFSPDVDDDHYEPYRDLEYTEEWTTNDVAFYFSVDNATVRQWVRRGYLAPVRTEQRTHVFESTDAIAAGAAITSRTNAPPGPQANIRPKHHDRYVSCELAAAAVGVAPSTVRSWIHRGRLATQTPSAGRVTVRVGDVFDLARTSPHRRRT